MWNTFCAVSLENLATHRRLPHSTTDGKQQNRILCRRPVCIMSVLSRHAKRDDRGDTVYHPQFLARVSASNQDTFVMRMSSEWFKAARSYTDSPSLGRCVHHVRGTTVKKALRNQVHQPKFKPKDWEFEVLTKLMVLGHQPAQTQELATHEVIFFRPTLSPFDSPSGHHCAGIPKSKGERSNPTKRAGKLGTATNNPRRSKHHMVRE
jgi:hypothetical protein